MPTPACLPLNEAQAEGDAAILVGQAESNLLPFRQARILLVGLLLEPQSPHQHRPPSRADPRMPPSNPKPLHERAQRSALTLIAFAPSGLACFARERVRERGIAKLRFVLRLLRSGISASVRALHSSESPCALITSKPHPPARVVPASGRIVSAAQMDVLGSAT